MLKEFSELSVLEQGDDGAIVSVSGQNGPSVLLGAAYVEHLANVSDRAFAELSRVPERFESDALRLLCVEVTTLVGTYRETCNKYYGGPPAEASFKAAMEEVERLRRLLEASFGALPGAPSAN